MKKQFFISLFLLIFSDAFASMEVMKNMKKWFHPDNKVNPEAESSPYYTKVTDLIIKKGGGFGAIELLALDKAICFFQNTESSEGLEKNIDLEKPLLIDGLPNDIKNNRLIQQKAQNLFQTALTAVYREAKNEGRSKTDKEESKTTSKPDVSSKK